MGTNVEREVTLRAEKCPMQFIGAEGVVGATVLCAKVDRPSAERAVI